MQGARRRLPREGVRQEGPGRWPGLISMSNQLDFLLKMSPNDFTATFPNIQILSLMLQYGKSSPLNQNKVSMLPVSVPLPPRPPLLRSTLVPAAPTRPRAHGSHVAQGGAFAR
eukprot:bmy_16553T0